MWEKSSKYLLIIVKKYSTLFGWKLDQYSPFIFENHPFNSYANVNPIRDLLPKKRRFITFLVRNNLGWRLGGEKIGDIHVF